MPDFKGDRSRLQQPAPSIQGVYNALRGGHLHLRADEATAAALERAVR